MCSKTRKGNQNKFELSTEEIIGKEHNRLNMARGATKNAFEQFAKGLMEWSRIMREIDFNDFKEILEQIRGHKIADGYALELWDLMNEPHNLRQRLRSEFPKFMQLAILKQGMAGRHDDLIP
jgi:hypothetical protein